MSSTRRAVNALVTRPRSRVWSGGSCNSIQWLIGGYSDRAASVTDRLGHWKRNTHIGRRPPNLTAILSYNARHSAAVLAPQGPPDPPSIGNGWISRPRSRDRGRELKPQTIRDGLVCHTLAVNVQPCSQVSVFNNFGEAPFGKCQTKGQRCIVQRLARSKRNCSRHVRDAVVNDPVTIVCGVRVGCRMGCLEAATLVDRHVNQHRAGLHRFEHLTRDELWRAGTWNQHGTDHDIGREHFLFVRMPLRAHPPAKIACGPAPGTAHPILSGGG